MQKATERCFSIPCFRPPRFMFDERVLWPMIGSPCINCQWLQNSNKCCVHDVLSSHCRFLCQRSISEISDEHVLPFNQYTLSLIQIIDNSYMCKTRFNSILQCKWCIITRKKLFVVARIKSVAHSTRKDYILESGIEVIFSLSLFSCLFALSSINICRRAARLHTDNRAARTLRCRHLMYFHAFARSSSNPLSNMHEQCFYLVHVF